MTHLTKHKAFITAKIIILNGVLNKFEYNKLFDFIFTIINIFTKDILPIVCII